MQINVWGGRIARPLLELIRDEAPDIIFTQEMYSYPETIPAPSPWAYFDTLGRIASEAKFEHTFFSACTTFTIFGRTLSYGNAILSKLPLAQTTTLYTAGSGPVHFDQPTTVEHNLTRNYQHAIVDTGRTKLNLINHHAHWAANPAGDEVSFERLQQVADYIATLTGPTILCGDLNLSPSSPAFKQFIANTGLHEALAGTEVTTTLSPAHYVAEPIQCDHILTSPALKIIHADTSDKIVSDHKAIIAEIDC